MTSQVKTKTNLAEISDSADCHRPADFPKEYCHKLKSGLARLEAALRLQYEEAFPGAQHRITGALEEAKEAAWSTPFPALFFPALAHLRVREVIPLA